MDELFVGDGGQEVLVVEQGEGARRRGRPRPAAPVGQQTRPRVHVPHAHAP